MEIAELFHVNSTYNSSGCYFHNDTSTCGVENSSSTAAAATTTILFDESNRRYILILIRFWIQRVLVPLIMVIGVVGNTVTIVIMTRRRMRSSTNIYLAALASYDMMYLICTFLLSIKHYPNTNGKDYYFYWRLRPFLIMLVDTCSNTSVWLTVTFTIERYIAVCHPIRGKALCTESRAKKVICCVSLVCITLTLPTPFEYTIVDTIDTATNQTIYEEGYSDMGRSDWYRNIYYWSTVVIFTFIPLLSLAIFNALLIRSVHVSKKQRKIMTSRDRTRDSSRQEHKITIMLIAVVLMFFFCQLPTATILLYTAFRSPEPDSKEYLLIHILGNVFNYLMAINAAGNFVLYCLLSQKYRRTFLQTFCPCLKGKLTRLHSVYQNTVYSNIDNSPGSDRKAKARNNLVAMQRGNNKTQISSQQQHNKGPSFLELPNRKSLTSSINDCNNAQTECVDCAEKLQLHQKGETKVRFQTQPGNDTQEDGVAPVRNKEMSDFSPINSDDQWNSTV